MEKNDEMRMKIFVRLLMAKYEEYERSSVRSQVDLAKSNHHQWQWSQKREGVANLISKPA